jgi:predicted dehydrogenase
VVTPGVQLRCALIGSSGFAEAFAAPALREASVDLTGVLGSTPDRSGRLVAEGYGRPFGSLGELTAAEDVDAVWITTPDPLHAPIALACLRAGKHVLVEKPMATSAADADELVDAAARNGLVLRVGCHQRFRPGYQDLRALVRGGSLGKVGFARAHYYAPFHAMGRQPTEWRTRLRDSGGSWATKGLGSHLLDLMLWLTGARHPAVVGAVFANHQWPVETEDTATLLIGCDDDLSIVATMSFGLQGGKRAVEIYGTGGWVRAHDLWYGSGHIETGDGQYHEFPADRLGPYVAQVEDFAVAAAGQPSIGADAEAGLVVTRLIAEALAAGGRAAETPRDRSERVEVH